MGDEGGNAALVGCVVTGETAVEYGTRLSCGLLEKAGGDVETAAEDSSRATHISNMGLAGINAAAVEAGLLQVNSGGETARYGLCCVDPGNPRRELLYLAQCMWWRKHDHLLQCTSKEMLFA